MTTTTTTPPPSPPAAPPPPPVETKTGGKAGSPPSPPPPAGDGGAPPPAGDQIDWRKVLAGSDEKALKALERYESPTAYQKAFADTQKALRDGGRVKIPGKDATDDDIRAFREARGIPEDPAKYTIGVKPPEGIEVGEADQAMLSEITKRLHGYRDHRSDPAVVETAHELYYDLMARRQQAMDDQLVKTQRATAAELKEEWKGEFKTNLALANASIGRFFNVAEPSDITGIRLADGSALGDNPAFIRAMAAIGRANSEDPLIAQAVSGSDAKSVDHRIADIQKLRTGSPHDRAEYARQAAPGGELYRLLQLKITRESGSSPMSRRTG